MNILELRKAIQTFLLTKTTRVYFENAPENAAYPYVVFNLPSSTENYQREDFRLEVDIWGNSNDTTALETLVGNIDGDGHISAATGLHRKHIYTNGVIQADIYRESRLVITDPDESVKRRQLIYTVKTYL